MLARIGVSGLPIERVVGVIEATQHHTHTHGDAALIVDVDLSILGSVPSAFDQFEKQIRQEYAHVPELLYRFGRSRVLRRFLAKPHIYASPTLREALEMPAQRNLQRRLVQLRRHGQSL